MSKERGAKDAVPTQPPPTQPPKRRGLAVFLELNQGRPIKALHGFAYFRWWRQYLSLMFWGLAKPSLLPRWLYDRIAAGAVERQHSKVVPPREARSILTVAEDINYTNLEHVVPYSQARDVVLSQPLSLAVVDCACRAANPEPCEPQDVCIAIGDALTDFLVGRDILGARRIDVDEALAILEREHRRGRVQTAWFKDAAGARLYCICNCCACCCIGLRAVNRYRIPVVISSGYVAALDEERCDSCGACPDRCQFGAISANGRYAVDADLCMGCGVCVDSCSRGALRLERDPRKPEPLDLARMMSEESTAPRGPSPADE